MLLRHYNRNSGSGGILGGEEKYQLFISFLILGGQGMAFLAGAGSSRVLLQTWSDLVNLEFGIHFGF